MTEELLPYYNRELAFLRKLGADFAEAHPKIAGRLRLGSETVEDPHVSRLIESFAYLTARIRHKLDDDFPELTESLLGVLYPHYLAPVPSMAIVNCQLDRTQGELTSGYRIPRGSMIESEPAHGKGVDGETCRFQTSYDVTLWPIELTQAEFKGRPFIAPPTRFNTEAQAIIRLQLECLSPKAKFGQMPLKSLRFFLKGQTQYIYDLYEILMNHCVGVSIASSSGDRDAVAFERDSIQPVGFERDQGILPYSPRSFLGYRLLTEYFAFPEKFLFFDIVGFNPNILSRLGNKLEIYILLNRQSGDLEKNVSKDTFQLGCTPIVNLFPLRAEPIQLTHQHYEYHVVPDARRTRALEIYSINRVVGTSPHHTQAEFQPFYALQHALTKSENHPYWHASRRSVGYSAGQIDRATEMYLSLVDLEFSTSVPADWTLDIETTCLNRDLPRMLEFGGGRPYLQLVSGGGLAKVSCVTPPTATLRPSLRRGTLWRLISHLSLNHLSLVESDEGAVALREILTLYNFTNSASTQAIIDGIESVRSRRVVGRVGGDVASGFCRGVEVSIRFDEDRFSGSGVYLFASVLERFLGLYCSVNSFSKLVASTNRREGDFRRWPPRAGERVLL